ncbi:MAG: hypothetical protein IH874_00190 [Candidatus Dadabacteria bacterium]|nr:hypothetical protein [Candidatus Dadabacteria bacterium]
MHHETTKIVFLGSPGIVEVVVLVLLFAVVLLSSVYTARRLGSLKQKATLSILRALSFILMALILLNPAKSVEQYREDKPRLAVLIDSSYSMNLPSGDSVGTPRIEALRDFIERSAPFWSGIERDFITSYYTFDSGLRDASSGSVGDLLPVGKHSAILGALKEVAGAERSLGIDRVLLISDGAQRGVTPEALDDAVIDLPFPVYTLAVAKGDIKDIRIEKVRASGISFLKRPFKVEVEIGADGITDVEVPVTIKEGSRVVLTKQALKIPGSGRAGVEFQIKPTAAGRKVYTVSIPAVSGDQVPENNERSFVVDVIIDRIRVLHISGSPSWDSKFLRKSLKRNPNVDLVAFFILRDPSDLVFASQNELSLIPFPVNDLFGPNLENFDVLIFQNFKTTAYGVSFYHLNNIRKYVLNKGGAFLMIGGVKSFDGGLFGSTPLRDVLPVRLRSSRTEAPGAVNKQLTKAKLTRLGEKHAVMSIVPKRKNNKQNWNSLPALDGYNIVGGVKPGAQLLLRAPGDAPLFVLDEAGSGKVASFLSDSSWRWAFLSAQGGEKISYYDRFWGRLLRWLVDDPELKDVRVSSDKAVYNPGDTANIDVWTLGEEKETGELSTTVTLPGGEEVELSLKRSGEGMKGVLLMNRRGVYRASVKGETGAGHGVVGTVDETYFVMEAPLGEVFRKTADTELLKQIAKKTGGSFSTVWDKAGGLGLSYSPKLTITGYKTQSVWDTPLVFALLVGVFAGELILRRRWGLR